MTRCPEYYGKWEKDPNWCNLCPSAVSQIETYLEWVDLIQSAGADRKFTFVKLSEYVARELNQYNKLPLEKKRGVAKNLAEYIKDPQTKKLDKKKIMSVAASGMAFCRKYNPPSWETQLRRNEKQIENYRLKIANLEHENALLRKTIQKHSTNHKTPGLEPAPIPQNNGPATLPPPLPPGASIEDVRKRDDALLDYFGITETPGVVKTIGHDAARAKLRGERS